MRVFFNAIILQIFLTAYVFLRGWQLLPHRKPIRIAYLSFFIFELLLYFVGFLASRNLPAEIVHTTAWIGTSWMILISFLGLFLLVYDFVSFIDRRKRRLLKYVDLTTLKVKRIYFCMSLLFVLILMFWGNHNFRNPQVTELTLEIEKHSPHVKELKIVVTTDIHAGYLIDKKIIRKYVDLIMEQKPDLILLPGDIIDYDLYSVEKAGIEEEFKRLKAPYGVFASLGNHEYILIKGEKKEDKINWLKNKSGFTLLRDSAVSVNNSFYVVGRDDDGYKFRKTLNEITDNIDKNLPIIVLRHQPHKLQQDVDGGADLAVYGHTHNGQVFPANLLVKLMYEVGYGYKKKENTHVYVSSGLGLAGPQYRIGTKSEIVVLHINFK